MAVKKQDVHDPNQLVVERARDFWTRFNRPLMIVCAIIVLVAGGYIGYRKFYSQPKEELEEYRGKDPIQQLLKTILDKKIASEEQIKNIDSRVEKAVAESVKFAEESPFPDDSEVLKDIYVDPDYPFIVD